MKLISAHWVLHPDKSEGLYYDETGKPRSPWYDKEIVEKQMSESAVARELDLGYELSVEGVVFKEFRDSHILRRPFEIDPELPIIRYFDYGRVNATLFSQKDHKGRIVFFKEIVLEKSGTHEQGKIVQSESANLITNVGFRDYGDPAGSNPDQRTDTNDVEILGNYGCYPTATISGSIPNRRQKRIELMKMKLSERIDGCEIIMVHQDCQFLIDAFQFGYRYKEDYSGKVMDEIHEVHPYEDVMDCAAGTILEEFSAAKLPNITPRNQLKRNHSRNKYTGYGH